MFIPALDKESELIIGKGIQSTEVILETTAVYVSVLVSPAVRVISDPEIEQIPFWLKVALGDEVPRFELKVETMTLYLNAPHGGFVSTNSTRPVCPPVAKPKTLLAAIVQTPLLFNSL
ncbi:MAG: hypothetical protein UR19_C0003G0252 [Candidatus Nomurabacteria bacterium GW2011_GWF1_31_48]|uniref:Uncharacterized protein n=1 Tax=Candidatus Nomurabacteria bacterium GW2011_GWF1_31_48 TaxID=1618767 RepID=A0A0F9YVB3_9BACT|nr:MAG: hypothetical protein UR19_C0003G0252 [Candidatus Nomurabacteria bacterium GW2011_GWF1_31_48]